MVQGREEFKQRASLSVVLEKAEFDAFEEIRWRERMSRSEIGRKAIVDYIKAHAAGNSTFKLDQFTDPNFRAMPATMSTREKWYDFVKNNTDRQERAGLKDITTYITKCVDAVNWEQDHPEASKK